MPIKPESFHSLLTAKTLFASAERHCQSSNTHTTTAGVVMLQDAVELFFLACALERSPDEEDSKLEKASFPELLGHLRRLNIKVAKSGTLTAMNKTRVVAKHYGQACAPAAAATYLQAARIAIDAALLDVFGVSLVGVFMTSMMQDCPGKWYLDAAVSDFQNGDYNSALIRVRQALFKEFEEEYYVEDWREDPGNEFSRWSYRGWKAPAYARESLWVRQQTDPFQLVVLDRERLRFDMLEIGANIQDFLNVCNRTPKVVEPRRGGMWLYGVEDLFVPYTASKEAAEACIDETITLIIKKQSHANTLIREMAPPGMHYQRTMSCDAPARFRADHDAEVAWQIARGTEVIYLGATAAFNGQGELFAKVMVFGNSNTFYVPQSAVQNELRTIPTPPPPPGSTELPETS